jgi:hypothetical protein
MITITIPINIPISITITVIVISDVPEQDFSGITSVPE